MKLVRMSESVVYDALTEAFTTAEAFGVHKDVVGAVFGVGTPAYSHWLKKRQVPKSPMYYYTAKLVTATLRRMYDAGELTTDEGLTKNEAKNVLVVRVTKNIVRTIAQ
jgi:hypothetical protein